MDLISNHQVVIQKIAEICSPYYQSLDEWHNLTHAQRVLSFAEKINENEKADPFLVKAGAWLHQYHEPNLHRLPEILEQLKISPEQKNNLVQIVQLCRPNKIGTRPSDISDKVWHAAQVVFDADGFDLLGPSGFIREFTCNLKFRNMSTSEALKQADAVHDLFLNKLQTPTAKSLAATLIPSYKEFKQTFSAFESDLNKQSVPSY